MRDPLLCKAIALALESILTNASNREQALANADAEVARLLRSNSKDEESVALLTLVREEIANARSVTH